MQLTQKVELFRNIFEPHSLTVALSCEENSAKVSAAVSP